MKRYLVLFFALFFSIQCFAQNAQQSLWGGWFNSVKVGDKLGLHLDVQVRSADDVENIRNVLFRPGLTYNFNAKQNVTAGYAYIGTFPEGNINNSLTEHRIWEQFIQSYKISALSVTHRLRLEQRFMETTNNTDLFSQRIRYFARLLLPIKKGEETFSKGFFGAFQNEVFLHLQNKDQLNKSTFDQNRAYLAIGYRINSKFDIEAGYMNQFLKGINSNTTNNIAQLAFYTRF